MTGKKIDFTKSVKNGPDINGFDQYYGHCSSLDMPPYVWVDTGQITAPPDREEGVTKAEDRYGWYRKGPIGSDFNIPEVLPHLFDKSMDYVKSQAEHAKEGKPFFLYLALPAPHTPIVPVPPYKDASGLNPYADFVMQLDDLMGQLLHTVKESGLDDNTLVIFTSDNGCSPEANFPLLQEKGHNPSGKYRGHKADIYEGGHRVPFIVRWPGEIEEGRKTEAMTCLTDVYATLEAITGQEKQTLGGEDGYSLLPVFQGETSSNRDTLISHSDYVLSWLREEKGSKSKTKNHKGGQRKPRELRELVIEIAKTTGFGYTRIIGELRKLGIKNISRQTVRNILKEEEIQPGPDRTSDSWTEFLNRHGETLWASDFFLVKSTTARGIRDLYVMVFLNLQTREAIVTESTYRPNSAWVYRQTKKFADETSDREKRPAILIHDRDTKYTKKFRETVEAGGMNTNPLPKASPNLNGRCERFIETIKLECLNKFIVFGKKHLDYLTIEFTSYYNTKRSHMERDHLPPIREEPDEVATISIDQIEVKKYVGGLIKSFERKVA